MSRAGNGLISGHGFHRGQFDLSHIFPPGTTTEGNGRRASRGNHRVVCCPLAEIVLVQGVFVVRTRTRVNAHYLTAPVQFHRHTVAVIVVVACPLYPVHKAIFFSRTISLQVEPREIQCSASWPLVSIAFHFREIGQVRKHSQHVGTASLANSSLIRVVAAAICLSRSIVSCQHQPDLQVPGSGTLSVSPSADA